MDQFNPGQQIKTLFASVTIKKHLTEGGQGHVYLVQYNNGKNEEKILKWYKDGAIKDLNKFYNHLKDLLDKGAPADNFMWPIDIAEITNGSFGYVMNIIPGDYKELNDFTLAKVQFTSFKGAVQACLEIVNSYRLLHNKGFCYQDMNGGNFFIHPGTGHVLICDNDNVAPNNTDTTILGTPGYMAPEVVLGKGKPNTQTDRFSMAVILFIILCMNHPLEGKRWTVPCLTPDLERILYGSDPLFIYDPENRDNAPVKNVHTNVMKRWEYLPDYMKDIFIQAFSHDALMNPGIRVREVAFQKALVRFQSDIVRCPQCNNEIFVQNASATKCDGCGKMYPVSTKIKLPEYNITAAPKTMIYRCQLVPSCNADEALDRIGMVVQNTKTRQLGIRNVSNQTIEGVSRSGAKKPVSPGEVVPLLPGIKLIAYEKTIEIM